MDNDLILLRAKALSVRGYEYLKTARFDEALEVYAEATALYGQINDDEAESKHIRIIADLFHAAGQPERSLNLYRDLLSKYMTCGKYYEIGMIQNNIGLLLTSMQRYQEAENSFLDSLKSFETFGDELGVAEQLANLGSVHRDQQVFSTAIYYYQLALERFERIGNSVKVSDQLSNLGYIYVMLGDKLNACNHFERAKNLYIQNGENKKADLAARNIAAMTSSTC
jgi:tetratricopeptide (TPR) repeat protein